jgi:hypothetical protein
MRTSLRTALFGLATLGLALPSHARPPEADVVTKLPGRAEEAAVAGAGRFLVLKIKGSRELAVYDAINQKLSAVALPDEEYLFAAGGDVAVVYLPKRNEIRSIDLKTGKALKSKEFIDKPNIVAIVMGHSRDDLALVRVGRTPQGNIGQDLFLDAVEIRVSPVKYNFGATGGRPQEMNQVRANGDMTRLVEWVATPTPTGTGVLTRTADGYSFVFGYATTGPVIPGDDGRVYTALGTTLDVDPTYNPSHGGSPFKTSAPVKGRALVPAVGAQFHLAVSREGGLTLYQAKSSDAIAPVGDFPGWAPTKPDAAAPGGGGNGVRLPDGRFVPAEDLGPGVVGEGKEPLTLDRRLVFAPGHGHILFLPHSNDRVVQRTFDLKSTLDQTGEDYLMVLSAPSLRAKGGAAWDYAMKSVAKNGPVKYELVQSPEGMAISAEGKLTWTPPKGIVGKAPVEVKLTDAKGRTARQAFEVILD